MLGYRKMLGLGAVFAVMLGMTAPDLQLPSLNEVTLDCSECTTCCCVARPVT